MALKFYRLDCNDVFLESDDAAVQSPDNAFTTARFVDSNQCKKLVKGWVEMKKE